MQPPVGNWTPPTSRARVKPAALRRGRRADPHFWGLAPRICEPTSALIAAYASTAATAYSSSAAITAYSSAATITRYTSTAVITGYGSSSAITGYGTSSTIVTYTSTGSISRCSGP